MMGKVYRYVDIRDNFIKYVGIVYGENRTLEQRHKEHIKNEIWCDENFIVQYLDIPVNNRTEAETLESHFISLYGSGKWYNKSKSNWGQSSFLPQFDENNWQELDYVFTSQDIENIKRKRINSNQNNNLLNNEKLNKIVEKLDILIGNNRNSFESINRSIKYSGLTDKNQIENLIQETLSSGINNIREKISISLSEEINNKIDSINGKFRSALEEQKIAYLKRVSELEHEFSNIKGKKNLWRFFAAIFHFFIFMILITKR